MESTIAGSPAVGSGTRSVEQYQTLQDIVYDTLRDDILTGKLESGEPLNTSDLSRKLNISRTPIREAVNKLVVLGLAEKTNHKEARVANFLSDEMIEIYYVRCDLEALAARCAAKYLSEAEKQQLAEVARRFADVAENRSDDESVKKFIELDAKYHAILYSAIKTPLLRTMANQLYVVSGRARLAGYSIAERRKKVVREHQLITEFVCAGDAENAEIMGRNHHKVTIDLLKQERDRKK